MPKQAPHTPDNISASGYLLLHADGSMQDTCVRVVSGAGASFPPAGSSESRQGMAVRDVALLPTAGEAVHLQGGGVHDALVVFEGERDGVLSHSRLSR